MRGAHDHAAPSVVRRSISVSGTIVRPAMRTSLTLPWPASLSASTVKCRWRDRHQERDGLLVRRVVRALEGDESRRERGA